MPSRYPQFRAGLAALGLRAYWPQFAGLEERLRGYLAEVERVMGSGTRTVVNLGMVDTVDGALEAGHRCRSEDVDFLVVYVATYSLSAVALPLIRLARTPVLLLNLQPSAALDYAGLRELGSRTAMTGEWLAYCSACPVPELANVLRRLGMPFQQVTGALYDDPQARAELEAWLRAAETVHALGHSRLGLMGHYYSGMLDVATDLVQVSGRFGVSLEMLEAGALSARRRQVTAREIADKVAEFQEFFAVDPECSAAELERAARTALALDRMVAEEGLDLLAYYLKGSGMEENEDTISSIIPGASMLTGRGVPVAGEYEVKNVIAMKMMDLLGLGGSFTEYYAMDYAADVVLMGHDGPGHIRIAEDRIQLKPLAVYHGKVGAGLSVEMSVRNGPVTLLSVVEDAECGFRLLLAEGESVPGPVLPIGNTNSRYRFAPGARKFAEAWNAEGPAHHCAVGVGHAAAQLKKVASLLEMPVVQIC